MTRTRRTFLVIAAVTVTAIGVSMMASVKHLSFSPSLSDSVSLLAEPETVDVTIASSLTKQRWMEGAITQFEAAKIRTSSGKLIKVKSTSVLSGDSMERILAGQLHPVVWSPGEASWISQFDAKWKARYNKSATSGSCQPTVYTPSGIAMWRPMAEALGWPKKSVSWKMIVELNADPRGWGRYGHPEWGKFKLGYTHPQYSSAGLLFLASLVYGITGHTDGLTADQVYSKPVTDGFFAMAQNTAKYGMASPALLDMMARSGPDYLHAVSAFEEGAVRFNFERGRELRFPLAFLFPAEGTFWSNHPFCVLDQTDWVSADQAEAAKLFLEFLRAKPQQQLATEYMLRPLDDGIAAGDKLTLVNGTVPNSRPNTVPAFELPSADAASAIIDQFIATKRKARVMLVLDVSGSMNGDPIRAATEATAAFLKRLDPRDEVGLMIFNDQVSVVSEILPAASVSEELSRRVLQLVSGGGTNLNGAVCRTVEKMKAQPPGNWLNGIVLLSDGADTSAEISENRMFQTCLPTSAEADGLKIFSIAFGEAANLDVLNRLSHNSGGAIFKADPNTINDAYLKISAEQ